MEIVFYVLKKVNVIIHSHRCLFVQNVDISYMMEQSTYQSMAETKLIFNSDDENNSSLSDKEKE